MPFDQYIDTYLINLIDKYKLTVECSTDDDWFVYTRTGVPYIYLARNPLLREALITAHILLEGYTPREKHKKPRRSQVRKSHTTSEPPLTTSNPNDVTTST